MYGLQQYPVTTQATPTTYSLVVINELRTFVVSAVITAPDALAAAEWFRDEVKSSQVSTSLELHQAIQRWIAEARQQERKLHVSAAVFNDKNCSFCTLSGAVLLKRGSKVGTLLSSATEAEVIEGGHRSGDIFILVANSEELELSQIQQLTTQQKSTLGILEKLETLVAQNVTGVTIAVVTFGEDAESGSSSAPGKSFETNKGKFTSSVTQLLQRTLLRIKQLHRELFSQDAAVRKRLIRKLFKIIFPFMLVLVILGVILFFLRSQTAARERQIQSILEPVRTQLQQARVELHQNPVLAREQTEEVIATLDQLSEQHKSQRAISRAITAERESVRQFYDQISGQQEFSVLPTFFDLRFVQSSLIANTFDLHGETMIFLDKGQKKILALNVARKQPTLLPTGDQEMLKDIAFNEKELFILSNGIFRFDLSSSELAKEVRAKEEANEAGEQLRLFDQFLYVLNKERRNIYRYTIDKDGKFSDPIGWLQSSQDLDFPSIQTFAVDGDLWISTQTGEIKKFSSGRQVEFSTVGLKENFSSPITLFTKADLKNLYILEPQKNRVVVLSKAGEFVKEIRSSTLASVTDVVAEETQGKIFALSGSLVFEIQL